MFYYKESQIYYLFNGYNINLINKYILKRNKGQEEHLAPFYFAQRNF